MDSQQTFDFFKKGLHVTLGATTALVESVQDPYKREENLAQLNLGFDELARLWEAKGETTETEARQFIDTFVSSTMGGNNTSSATSTPASNTNTFNPAIIQELQELTTELAAIRAELSKPEDISLD